MSKSTHSPLFEAVWAERDFCIGWGKEPLSGTPSPKISGDPCATMACNHRKFDTTRLEAAPSLPSIASSLCSSTVSPCADTLFFLGFFFTSWAC